MRIQPDGLELLRAARVVMNAAIIPYVRSDRRDLLPPIEAALTIAEECLLRDGEARVEDLAALESARAALRGDVLEALPERCQFDARLVAQAIAVAGRQLAHGGTLERREFARVAALLGSADPVPSTSSETCCKLASLTEELCARIRAGEADWGTSAYTATLEHLETTTLEALSESNPTDRPPIVGPSACAMLAPAPKVSFVDTAVSAWVELPQALVNAWIDAPSARNSEHVDACDHLSGVLGEAVFASGNALISAQSTLMGCLTKRLAANPDVPMLAVEGAHQAHDLSVAIADATMAFWKLALAPFRGARWLRAEAARWP